MVKNWCEILGFDWYGALPSEQMILDRFAQILFCAPQDLENREDFFYELKCARDEGLSVVRNVKRGVLTW